MHQNRRAGVETRPYGWIHNPQFSRKQKQCKKTIRALRGETEETMQIDKNLVMYLEKLGRIELSEEQRAASEKDLQDILTYMDTLNELDTDGVEPASHSFPVANVQRDDVVTNAAQTEAILQNAPNQKDGCFVVPKTVE